MGIVFWFKFTEKTFLTQIYAKYEEEKIFTMDFI